MIKVNKDTSLDDVLEALKTVELLGQAQRDLLMGPDLAQRVREERDTRPELVKNLTMDKEVRRVLRGKLRGTGIAEKRRKKLRAEAKAKHRNKEFRQTYQERKKYLNQKRRDYVAKKVRRNTEWANRLSNLDDVEGYWKWWGRVSNTSGKWKPGWEISLEEYREHVHPVLRESLERGTVPVTRRIDTKKPWTLDNTLWVKSGTRCEVVFDGSMHKLVMLGYAIDPSLNSAP